MIKKTFNEASTINQDIESLRDIVEQLKCNHLTPSKLEWFGVNIRQLSCQTKQNIIYALNEIINKLDDRFAQL